MTEKCEHFFTTDMVGEKLVQQCLKCGIRQDCESLPEFRELAGCVHFWMIDLVEGKEARAAKGLSCRNIEQELAETGVKVSYRTIARHLKAIL